MARSYLIVVICQAAAAAAAIAALRWLAVFVDPETFGQYTLFQSVISAMSLFLISWPNAALLRFGREEWVHRGTVGATLGARLALFVACLAVAIAFAWLFDFRAQAFLGLSSSVWKWVSLGIVVVPAAELAIYASQAVGRTEIYGYSPLITRAGFLIGVMLIPWWHPAGGWTYLASCFMLSSVAATLFAFATMPRGAWKGFEIRPMHVLTLVSFSWTLPFAGVSTYVVNWIDAWVIRDVKGMGLVGVYNWAYQATAIAGLAFAPIAVVLTPRVIDARLRKDAVKIAGYTHAILPAAIGMALATNATICIVLPLVYRFVPPAYAASYPVVLVLLAALPAQLISYLVTPLANAYEWLLPRIVGVSFAIAVMNVVGDLVLVPKIGIVGAAVATTSAFTIGALLLIVVIRAAGIEFGSLWTYSIPSLSLLPTLILLQRQPVAQMNVLMAAAAVTAMMVIFCRRIAPLTIAAFIGALTLSPAAGAVPMAEADRS